LRRADDDGTSAGMSDLPVPPPPANKTLRSTLFFVVVAGVLAVFVVLGQQSAPPKMPATSPHKLKLNLKGDLIGVEGEAGLDEALQPGFVLEKKAVEARVNKTCLACHGGPGEDLTNHACHQAGRCLPPHHPPKTECIKCHRMPPPTEKAPTD
jgi:hypothetical protein